MPTPNSNTKCFKFIGHYPAIFIIPSKDLWIIKTLGYLSRQELELNSSLRELIQTNLCHGCSDSRSKFYFRIKHIFSRASPDLKGFTSQATQVSTNNRQVTAKKITETFMDSTKWSRFDTVQRAWKWALTLNARDSISQNGGPWVIGLEYRDGTVTKPPQFITLSYSIACTASFPPSSELNPVRNMSKGD